MMLWSQTPERIRKEPRTVVNRNYHTDVRRSCHSAAQLERSPPKWSSVPVGLLSSCCARPHQRCASLCKARKSTICGTVSPADRIPLAARLGNSHLGVDDVASINAPLSQLPFLRS